MNTFPTDASVTVHLADRTALDGENAGVWGLGYNGQAVFENGAAKAYTTSPLEGDNYVIVMLQLDKGLIEPARFVGGSFDGVKNRAF